jgi:TusA-related sulfurtransferase
MNKVENSPNDQAIDVYLDITGEVCPLTFVKTKLLIEDMQSGQVAQVRLRGKEPLENVPRSVRDYGHHIISLEAEDTEQWAYGIHRLILKKA